MLNRPSGAAPWVISAHALATGLYQHPIPPDPLYELLRDTMWGFANDPGVISPDVKLDPLLSELFERPAHVYDPENPPDLPREYDPNYGRRRVRPSLNGTRGRPSPATPYESTTALYQRCGETSNLLKTKTMEDLHLAIQQAYGWYDDHLYSFFMSGKAWDKSYRDWLSLVF